MCRFLYASATVRDIHGLAAQHADNGAPPLTRGYVTANRDEQALETGLMLRHHLDASVPLVVALSQTHEVARLMNDVSTDRVLTNIDVFPTFERTCTMQLVEGGPFEAISRATTAGGATKNAPTASPGHHGPRLMNRTRSRAARRHATSRRS
jgi:hypothetical protein